MHGLKHAALATALLSAAWLPAACSPQIDLKQALQVTEVSSGWFDAGIVDGKNKLVPSVTFTLKQVSGEPLKVVSLNLTYRKVGDPEEEHHDDVFVQRVEFEGGQTQPLTVRSETGYTGDAPQTRLDMLRHHEFRDMEVRIFAKQGSSQWAELHRLTITRQLLTK